MSKVERGLLILAAVLAVALGVTLSIGGHSAQSASGSVHPPGWGRPLAGTRLEALPPQSTRIMWDAISLGNVPARPFAVAGYTAGRWPTWSSLARDFPAAHHVSIAIFSSLHADCLDVEPGDAVPSQVVAWIRADRAAGFSHPCVYSSLWEYVNRVRPLIVAAHIPRSSIFEWDADYRGCNGTIDSGFDATQCTDTALGRNLDESVVTPAFLSIAQPPYKPTPPNPVCFHHRISAGKCAAVKAEVARWHRAEVASRAALARTRADLASHGCRKPYRRGVCIHDGQHVRAFAQRARWFGHMVTVTEAAN